MEVKVNVGQLVDAIAVDEIEQVAGQIVDQLHQQIVTLLQGRILGTHDFLLRPAGSQYFA